MRARDVVWLAAVLSGCGSRPPADPCLPLTFDFTPLPAICNYPPPPPPTDAAVCASTSTWVVTGFGPQHLGPPPSNALWKATLRRRETVPLRVSTLDSVPDRCAPFVSAVSWNTSAAEVAEATADGMLNAQLHARTLGEAVVWATVTTSAGRSFRAETWATPPGTTRLDRLYGVVVVR